MSASSPSPTAAQRRAEAEATKEARMQQQRQRPLPTWLASRQRRRTLALVPAAMFAVGLAAALSPPSLGWLVVVVAALGVAGFLVMRRATQMLDIAPATLLDEREIGQRDRGYRDAFHLALTLAFALVVLAVLNGFAAKFSTGPVFDGDGWLNLTVTSFFIVFLLPAAALTWRWQPPTDEHDQ